MEIVKNIMRRTPRWLSQIFLMSAVAAQLAGCYLTKQKDSNTNPLADLSGQQMSPEQTKAFQDLMTSESFIAVTKSMKSMSEEQKATVLKGVLALRREGFKSAMERSLYMDQTNACMLRNSGLTTIMPPDMQAPANASLLELKSFYLDDVKERLRATTRADGTPLMWDPNQEWTPWFIQWGFAANKKIAVYMTFRSTIWYGKWARTGRQGATETNSIGEAQFRLLLVDPTENCKIIGASEVVVVSPKDAVQSHPYIVSWLALPTTDEVGRMVSDPRPFPPFPKEYLVKSMGASVGDRSTFDDIDYDKDKMKFYEVIKTLNERPNDSTIGYAPFYDFDIPSLYLRHLLKGVPHKKHNVSAASDTDAGVTKK